MQYQDQCEWISRIYLAQKKTVEENEALGRALMNEITPRRGTTTRLGHEQEMQYAHSSRYCTRYS